MPHDIRSAWFKTLGQLALILALAVVVGLLVGQVWPVVTVAALGVVAWHYWRLRKLQRQYLNLWAAVVARIRPEIAPADLQVAMHAVFGLLNSTAHSRETLAAADERGILAAAARRVLLG